MASPSFITTATTTCWPRSPRWRRAAFAEIIARAATPSRRRSRLRILHVTPFYEPAWAYGGMARAASGLCQALAGRGHEVTVVTARLDTLHPLEDVSGGVRVRRLPVPGMLQRLLVPWGPGLAPLLKGARERFDVAHLHGHRSGLNIQAASILAGAGVPWVLQPHGTFPHHGRHLLAKHLLDDFAASRVVRGATAVVAVSEAEARDLPRQAHVIPNGVAEPVDTPPVERRSGKLLFVGSDHPQKRADRLPALLEALPGTSLVLVGRYPPRLPSCFGRCRERVEVHGVLYPGDLARTYREASLVVHPARSEAFGLVPFEAALAGTPAVVAGGHGCAEWFSHAGGCVVPPDDEEAFVAAVRDRLADPARGEAEASAVAAFCREELTWERAAESVERLYRRLIESPAPR